MKKSNFITIIYLMLLCCITSCKEEFDIKKTISGFLWDIKSYSWSSPTNPGENIILDEGDIKVYFDTNEKGVIINETGEMPLIIDFKWKLDNKYLIISKPDNKTIWEVKEEGGTSSTDRLYLNLTTDNYYGDDSNVKVKIRIARSGSDR